MSDTRVVLPFPSAAAWRAPEPFHLAAINYSDDPSSMGELADRVGELKAAKAEIEGYIERMKQLFSDSDLPEAEGALFRVSLSAESCSASIDRKALERDMGEAWLSKYLKWSKPSRSFNCTAKTGKARRAP